MTTTTTKKPEDTLAEIAVVLDRSGSMQSIKDDMEGGLWTLIREQHGNPGRCRVSLYRFDDHFEVAFEGKASSEITSADCRLMPRGQTALCDAVVRSLSAIEARIIAEPEDARPDMVFVVVVTDGRENASKENGRESARVAVTRATEKFGWHFTFMAADLAGFEDAKQIAGGLRGATVEKHQRETLCAGYVSYSAGVTRARRGKGPEGGT